MANTTSHPEYLSPVPFVPRCARLVFFGSTAHAETFAQSLEWFAQACFPAFSVLRRQPGYQGKHGGGKSRWHSSLAGALCAVSVNSVVYGTACGISGPPSCWPMHLLPKSSGCLERTTASSVPTCHKSRSVKGGTLLVGALI